MAKQQILFLTAADLIELMPNISPVMRRQMGMICRNINIDAGLVSDPLVQGRISSEAMTLSNEIIDAHAVIGAAIAKVKGDLDQKNLRLSVERLATCHRVRADADALQQVILNLLSNAIKFTPVGGSITVHTEDGCDGRLKIDVKDTGIGIEPDAASRLFQVFQDAAGGQAYGALGVGLFVCKSLVAMYGGEITSSSAGLGKGATFTVYLPVLASAVAIVQPLATARLNLTAKGCRILLVEDHADTRRVMARLLQSMGCLVISVGSVADALAVCETNVFDLLLSDIGLPDGSGLDIMKFLKARQTIKGIAISGFAMEDDLRLSEQAGFEKHLVKPVTFQALQEVVLKMASANC